MPTTTEPRKATFLIPLTTEIRMLAEGEEKRSSEIQIALTGTWEHAWYGEFSIEEEDLDQMVANFEGGERDVVVDYQHGSTAMDPEAGKAAGWVKSLAKKEKGTQLWATVEWTDKAVEYIEAEEYKYISPEFEQNAKDKLGEKIGTVLYAVALTNRPFLEGMAPVMLSESIEAPAFYRLTAPGSTPAKRPNTEGGNRMEDARIREILGLNEGTEITDEHRAQALTKLDERVQELETGAEAVTEATGTEDLLAAATALTEGNLPGRIVLAEPDHAALIAAQDELKVLKDGQRGTVTLTEAQHQELKEGAEAGKQAKKELAENKADTAIAHAIDKEHRMLNDEAKGFARKALIADYEEGLKLLKSYPVMPKQMQEELGDDGNDGAGSVKAFIDEKTAGGMQLSEAMAAARKQFTAAEIDAYKYQPAA